MGDREVFFIAEDFGMTPEVNRAIVEAHRRGALQGASLMVGQPGTADAIRAAAARCT
jgi:chitin disaccharide deacetylase